MAQKRAGSGRGSSGWEWTMARRRGENTEFPFIEQFNFSRLVESKYLPPHRNDGYEFHYSDRGRYEFNVDGRSVTIGSGQAMMTCPWQEHSAGGFRLGPGRLAWLIIAPERATPGGKLKLGPWCHMSDAEQNELGKGLAAAGPLTITDQPECRRIMLDLRHEIEHRPPFFERRAEQLVVDLLLLAYRVAKEGAHERKKVPDLVTSALEAMAADVQRSWTIDELCSTAHLSKPALVKWVKTATGYTPMNYLLKLRIDHSCRRLAETGDTITAIAHDLGFNSSAHFSSAFRKFMLMSPRSYRQMSAEKRLDPESFQNERAVDEVTNWLNRNPDMPLSLIKKRGRFSAWPAFLRTFERVTGKTFNEFRASLKK